MNTCPLCGAQLDSMICDCGYDRSRDYTAHPTLAPLPPELPTFEMPYDDESEPRTATVKCPECGQEAVIREDDIFPVCAKCDKGPLNPKDAVRIYLGAVNRIISGGEGNPYNLYVIATQAKNLIQYADTKQARQLAELLDDLGNHPEKLGISLPEHLQKLFSLEARGLRWFLADNAVEINIFDEQEEERRKKREKLHQFARSAGFRHHRGAWHFPPFNADEYRRHTQIPQYRDAAAAYAKEDYETAAKLYQAAESEGNPYAAAHLGMMYYYGLGCEQDYTAAAKCFLRGTQSQCPLAAAWFCDCIRLGHGAEKEEAIARRLYAAVYPALRQMSDAGDNDARHFLGFNLLKGICTKKDVAAGIRLLEQAHAQGHRRAAVQLASCYYYGEGVARSYDTAFRLLRENQTASNKKAQFLLGLCHYWGNGTTQNYDLAFPCFKRAAELGHGTAKDYLGDCYSMGRGTEVNAAEAAKWYHDAADNHKNENAAHSLAFLYYNGQGVEQNKKTAYDYWMIAAEGGIIQAQRLISEEYMRGEYLEEDNEKGRIWMEKAAEQGDVEAQIMLGKYYVSDLGFDDERKAFSWFMKAAEQGNAEALYLVGGCYLYKLGTEQDTDKGVEYLIKASEAGNLQASKDLASYFYLGIENYKGQSYYTNPTLAHKHAMLAVAADETDSEAQYLLGSIIHHSFGNPAGAKEWYRRAIANGNPEAKLELSKVLIQLQENLSEAWMLLQDNTEAPIPEAQRAEVCYWRSVCLENGWGTTKNKRLAKQYYDTAIEKGYVDNNPKKKKRFGLF